MSTIPRSRTMVGRIGRIAGALALSAALAPSSRALGDLAFGDGARPEVRITVTHVGPGEWVAEYELPAPTTVAPFLRPPSSFRRSSWEVEAADAKLESAGDAERIVSTDGRPFSRFALRFRSDPTKHDREYVLTPRFTDGSEALYTGLLYVRPAEGSPDPRSTVRLVPAAGEHVVVHGQVSERPVDLRDTVGTGTYVYFGRLAPRATAGVLAIVDPALPEHLRTMYDHGLPHLFGYFHIAFGYELARHPVVLLGFTPSDRPGLSSHGDVLPGVIRFGFEGTGWAEHSDEVRARAFYLLAHEAAHLWNGDRFNSAENRESPWMHEGGAEAFAWLAMRDFGILGEVAWHEQLEDALNECLFLARGRTLRAAMSTVAVPYACGGILNMMVESALRDRGGLATQWRELFASAEAGDGRYTGAHYLATLGALSGEAGFASRFSAILDSGVEDRTVFLAAELSLLGVEVESAPPVRPRAARAQTRRAMQLLMQLDCGGRYSFVTETDGFVVNGHPSCHTLPHERFRVISFAGRSLGNDPAGAYQETVARCARGEDIAIGIEGGTELLVPCPGRMPGYLRVTAWPTAAAPSRRD